MNGALSFLVGLLLKTGFAVLVSYEVRGFVLAAPVLYALYESGGTLMAIWIAFCSLAGIAISVIAPLVVAKKIRNRIARWQVASA